MTLTANVHLHPGDPVKREHFPTFETVTAGPVTIFVNPENLEEAQQLGVALLESVAALRAHAEEVADA